MSLKQGAIDFLDGSESGQAFWVQDGGFPDVFGEDVKKESRSRQALRAFRPRCSWTRMVTCCETMSSRFRNVMPWFAQGVDAATGILTMHHDVLSGKRQLNLPLGHRQV